MDWRKQTDAFGNDEYNLYNNEYNVGYVYQSLRGNKIYWVDSVFHVPHKELAVAKESVEKNWKNK